MRVLLDYSIITEGSGTDQRKGRFAIALLSFVTTYLVITNLSHSHSGKFLLKRCLKSTKFGRFFPSSWVRYMMGPGEMYGMLIKQITGHS